MLVRGRLEEQGVVRCGGEVIVADTLKLGCGLPKGNLPSVSLVRQNCPTTARGLIVVTSRCASAARQAQW